MSEVGSMETGKAASERVAEQLAGELGEAVVIIQGFLMMPAMTLDQRKECIDDARKFITKLGL